jgi:peroxisomal enoyl-CoA hydratase 2
MHPFIHLSFHVCSDFNPLHADVKLAPQVGFPRPILHGLCSYGKCGYAIVKHFAGNDRTRFKSIEARFAQPVFPGETVEVLMWKTTSNDPKVDAIIFQARVKGRNALVLTNGYATVYKQDANNAKL